MEEITINILERVKDLAAVSYNATDEYTVNQADLCRLADLELANLVNVSQLIGNNPLQVMYERHYCHARFMSIIFKLNHYELLGRIVVWVYRAYHSRGFQYDYFLFAFHAWQKAINNILTKESAIEINKIYTWLINHHEDWINLAESAEYRVFSDNDINGDNCVFLVKLLHGDYKACLELTERYLEETRDLTTLYLHIIQPCLYEIGRLWEGGHVSVAQEHLATAIVARVMLSAQGVNNSDCCMGKAVIVCAPNELHELGARMISDLLENDGWQVDYLGVSLPVAELVKYVQSSPPQFIGIATSMPFNLDSTKAVIEAIRQDPALRNVKIMVGGATYHHEGRTWRLIGADGYAVDGAAAVEIARNWWQIKE